MLQAIKSPKGRAYFKHSISPPLVRRQKLLFACVVWLTFMYFFWKLGDPFPILSPKHGEFNFLADFFLPANRLCYFTFIFELLLSQLCSWDCRKQFLQLRVCSALKSAVWRLSDWQKSVDTFGLFLLVLFECHRKTWRKEVLTEPRLYKDMVFF